MPIYSFYIFDRHCECIYKKQWVIRDPNPPIPTPTDRRLSSTPHDPSAPTGTPSHPPSATLAAPPTTTAGGPGTTSTSSTSAPPSRSGKLSGKDDTKLVFGVIFSLRNMVRKLSGPADNFISYRTSEYKLHYYETPTNLKFVMISDVRMGSLRVVLHQIYVNLYVEFVVKNPLSPVEHPGGQGVYVDMFEAGLDQFIRTLQT